ncbi:hypothetical protein GCM10010168_35380 [Actinoplanes ianthinogenes]|uniref:Uncharacterized protein n=1 Tax=Actinoplanes ianthinogenes TaxID=122358 RepID=A0ABM7M5N2_9ACTN|nr:hypothetical protein [Actinoplanes ianthinogenes]BCJ46942.1 hypothetical protein Aiant_75990 [Actinoplanes ianthinogenes]GGR14476.1 hypothetical protein GCM10010168_35380 [Actinoplanes ianthinogenes]
MVDIGWVRRNGWVQRLDANTGGAMVLAVEATAFLLIAIMGTPFLLFFAADDDASVGWLWPFGAFCAASAVLGTVAGAAAFLIGSRGNQRDLQIGGGAALAIAGGAGLAAAVSASGSPLLALFSALVAVTNLGAARLLLTAEPTAELAEAPAVLPEAFLLAAPLAEAEIRTRETVEIEVRRPVQAVQRTATRARRPRGAAALHTLSGVQLPPRARRNRRR